MVIKNSMLVGGMDVSGDKIIGNYKYLAIIIGNTESITSLSDKISEYPTRMSKLAPSHQNRIISILEFDGKNRIALCIALDRTKIIDQVKSRRYAKRSRTPTGNIIRTFNHVIMKKIFSKIELFALNNSIPLIDIQFECDSDCIPFAQSANFKFTSEGKAHNIADKVAWCNNKHRSLQTVDEINFTNEIVEAMVKILKF